MIVLHTGRDARARVQRLVADATGGVFRGDPERSPDAYLPELTRWLKEQNAKALETRGRPIVVIDPAAAGTEAQRETLKAVRRMAKLVGADVHLVGDAEASALADAVVGNDRDLAALAPVLLGAPPTEVADPPMTPFRRAAMDVPTWQEVRELTGMSEQQAKERVRLLSRQEVWANNLYQVNVEHADPKETGGVGFAHLIIRRLDRRAVRDWRHFQTIKNELIGPECEAVELYPAERHLIDAKDHYHLWAFTSPEHSFGVGFRHGREVKKRQ